MGGGSGPINKIFIGAPYSAVLRLMLFGPKRFFEEQLSHAAHSRRRRLFIDTTAAPARPGARGYELAARVLNTGEVARARPPACAGAHDHENSTQSCYIT